MRKHWFAFLLFAVVLTVLIGRTFQDVIHSDAHETTEFVYLNQPDDITCGPTSAAMLLKYYGRPAALDDVTARSNTKWFEWNGKAIGMTSPDRLTAAICHFGVPAKLKRGSIDNLKHYVSDGRPVVVLIRSGTAMWHYVVVIGYTADTVVVADPSGGVRVEMPVRDFIGAWTFQTDMEGIPCGITCPGCGGRGTYSEWFPVSCDVCDGRKMIDPVKELLRAGEVYPQTMIVPDRKKE